VEGSGHGPFKGIIQPLGCVKMDSELFGELNLTMAVKTTVNILHIFLGGQKIPSDICNSKFRSQIV
jgi:hypothetical protein